MSKYEWLEKKQLRTVDQLRLWSENPRLDPEEKHVNLSDFASDLIAEPGEKDSFLQLVNSISSDGYIPADPVVVWKNNENDRYYVAEGNRRILALKLLRDPTKAPKPLRSYIRKRSEIVEKDSIEKIRVCIAPSFEACLWYINQRHASSSIQRRWSRHQQQRWIAELYDRYDGDIAKVTSITRLNRSQLKSILRILKIRDFALTNSVFEKLSADDQISVRSHRLPMTILERWFENLIVKEKWGIVFDEENVHLTSNRKSFFSAYTEWIKLVLHRDEPDVRIRIDTRTITSNFDEILKELPEVSFDKNNHEPSEVKNESDNGNSNQNSNPENLEKQEKEDENPKPQKPLYRDPERNQLVVSTYMLKTTNYKLDALFEEFKKIPSSRYKNCVAASLRVFLDLAVSEYIAEKNYTNNLEKQYQCSYHDITLKKRLEYLKSNSLKSTKPACKVLEKLLNHSNHYSLDILNNYIHGKDTQHTGKQFLNGFWDFLFPLFEEIIDIKEF